MRTNNRGNGKDRKSTAPKFTGRKPAAPKGRTGKRTEGNFTDSKKSDKPTERSYKKSSGGSYGKSGDKSYGKRTERGDNTGFRKASNDAPRREYKKRSFGEGDSERTNRGTNSGFKRAGSDAPKREYKKRSFGEGDQERRSSGFSKRGDKPQNRGFGKRGDGFKGGDKREYKEDKGYGEKAGSSGYLKRSFAKNTDAGSENTKKTYRARISGKVRKPGKDEVVDNRKNEDLRLNRFISNSGVCSRREADKLIEQGLITVNGKVVTELGVKVKTTDDVRYNGERLKPEDFVYLLLNKPKDYITTTEDEIGRKTVMDLLKGVFTERLYPVGRLDRNTTGLLLITNDGELAQKMMHPSFKIKKVYHVVLDKKMSGDDLNKLVQGVELEDGLAFADSAAFVESSDKRNVGLEIHSGKNRIVRRMFEALGYEVEKLDRVAYGVFTKKNLERGTYRYLSKSELGYIKKLKSAGKKKK